MKTYIGKIIERTRELLRIPIKGERKPLTEEEKRKRARLVVYPLFALLFAGCLRGRGAYAERETAAGDIP